MILGYVLVVCVLIILSPHSLRLFLISDPTRQRRHRFLRKLHRNLNHGVGDEFGLGPGEARQEHTHKPKPAESLRLLVESVAVHVGWQGPW